MIKRDFLRAISAATLAGGVNPFCFAASAPLRFSDDMLQAQCRALENQLQARIGVSIFDAGKQKSYAYRGAERFMLLSSFKLLASAFVLHRVDLGQESLARRITFSTSALVPWSPKTGAHADGAGMTLGELCEATITTSDNTAANLILDSFGGPAALTDYLRSLGDTFSRLDRNEPSLNQPSADGLQDTTSPNAMLGNLQALLMGKALSANSQLILRRWLLANTTGGQRLKAGLPPNWKIGDKTGTNETDANDIGITYPPGRPPFLICVYLGDSRASGPDKDAAIASIAAQLTRFG